MYASACRCMASRTPTLNLSLQRHISVRIGLSPDAVANDDMQSESPEPHLCTQRLAASQFTVFAGI